MKNCLLALSFEWSDQVNGERKSELYEGSPP